MALLTVLTAAITCHYQMIDAWTAVDHEVGQRISLGALSYYSSAHAHDTGPRSSISGLHAHDDGGQATGMSDSGMAIATSPMPLFLEFHSRLAVDPGDPLVQVSPFIFDPPPRSA